jgi:flagellar hook-associated protein 3 FlgL
MQIGASAYTFGNGVLSNVIGDAAAIRTQLGTLTQQAADGLVSDSYAGLGAGAAVSLSLNAALGQVQAWQNNTQAASGQMQVAQSALTQISSIASNFFAQTATLASGDSTAVDATAASARDALTQVAGLLDSQFGNEYVFAGADSGNPPVPDPASIGTTGMAAQITAAVQGLAANGAAATIASTLTIAGSNAAGVSPFSAALSQPAASLQALLPMVQTSNGQYTTIGILASANGAVASGGASTTGSYIRDILRALATIGAMSSVQTSANGYQALVQDTHTSLGDAISALNEDAGVLGNRQAALAAANTGLGDAATALQGQISNVQDVDMAATLSKLSATQTQLQVSYQLVNALRSMSLATVLGTVG